MAKGPFVARGRENQFTSAVHHASNLLRSGFSPALVMGGRVGAQDLADCQRIGRAYGLAVYQQGDAIYAQAAAQ